MNQTNLPSIIILRDSGTGKRIICEITAETTGGIGVYSQTSRAYDYLADALRDAIYHKNKELREPLIAKPEQASAKPAAQETDAGFRTRSLKDASEQEKKALNDPTKRQLLAEVPKDKRQVESIFRTLPWAEVLVLPGFLGSEPLTFYSRQDYQSGR